MPNEWDAFVTETAPSGSPQSEDWENFIPRLEDGSGISPDEMSRRSNLRSNWNKRSLLEKIVAAARSTVNNVPIIGEKLSPSTQPDVEEFRTSMPAASFGTNVVGSGAPLAAAGRRGLQTMFGTTPRSVISGGGIGAGDAYSRGQNPVIGGSLGAMFSSAGRGTTRAITPRSPDHPELVARGAADSVADIVPDFVPGGRRMNPFWQRRLERQAREQFRGEIADTQRQSRSIPEFRNLPPWARMLVGGGSALGLGAHPVLGAAVGLAAPRVERGVRRATNRVLRSKTYDKYINNQAISPENRALAAAIGLSLSPDPETLTGQR